MKKTMNILFCFVFLFSTNSFAEPLESPPEDMPGSEAMGEFVDNANQAMGEPIDLGSSGTPVTGPRPRPTGASEAASGQKQSGGQSCEQLRASIDNMCKNHPGLAEAQEQTGLLQGMQRGLTGGGAVGTAENMTVQGNAGLSGVNQAKADCEQTYTACKSTCFQESQSQVAANNIPAANAAQANGQYCEANHKEAKTRQGISMNSLMQLLGIAAMILSQLGKGGDSSPNLSPTALTDPKYDEECDGEMGTLLAKCNNGIDDSPINGAGRTGLTGVGGLGAGTGVPMLNASNMGEPGGTDKGNGRNGSGSGGGFGGGGGMPFGAAGFGAGTPGSGSGEKLPDSDIHKGYMGAGGGGGDGGGGSSSGGGIKAAGFGGDPNGANGLNSDLNKGIDKLTKDAQKRGLASVDGKAGPMQSIWEEVSKGYKKTSNTMIPPK